MSMTVHQRDSALAYANSIRLARAELKRDVRRRGLPAVMEIIEKTPREAETMTVFALLSTAKRWGPIRAGKFLATLHISESRMLRDLTERQRGAILARLDAAWGPR